MATVKIIFKGQDQTSSEAEKVVKSLDSIGKKTDDTGSGFGKFGEVGKAGLEMVGEFAVVGAEKMADLGGDIISKAGDFEASMNKLKFQFGASAEEMEKLKKVASEVGRETSFSSQGAADGMVQLAQAGFTMKQSTDLIGPSAKAAMLNNISLDASVETLTSTIHGFGVDTADTAGLLDKMTKAGLLGKLEFDDFGKVAENVGLIAKSTNQSFEGTTAEMLALTNTGMSAARASQAFRFALTSMEKPTKAAAGMMDELGLSYYDANGKFKDWATIVDEVQDKTKGMGEEQKNLTLNTLFGKNGILAYNAAVQAQAQVTENGQTKMIHGTEALRYWDKELKNSNGTVQNATDIMSTGFNFQLENLKGSIDEAMISIGTLFLPVLTEMIKTVMGIVNGFIDWETKTHTVGNVLKDVAEVVKSVFDAALPIIKDVLLFLANAFATVVLPALQKFGDFVSTQVIPAIKMMADWIGKTLGPVFESYAKFLTGTLLPGLGKLVDFIITNVVPVIKDWIEAIASFLQPVIEALAKLFERVVIPALTNVWNFISDKLIPVLKVVFDWIDKNLMPTFKTFAGILGNVVGVAINVLIEVINHFGDVLNWLWEHILKPVGDAIHTAFQVIGDAAIWLWNNALMPAFNMIGNGINNVGSFLENLKNAFVNAFNFIQGLMQGIGNVIVNVFKGAVNFVIDMINDVIGGINFFIGIARNVPGLGGIGNISTIPRWMADGGVVTKPTLIGAGEAGPEAVIPLSKLEPMLAGALKQAMIEALSTQNKQGQAQPVQQTFNLTANYPYQDRESLIHDVQILQAMGSKV